MVPQDQIRLRKQKEERERRAQQRMVRFLCQLMNPCDRLLMTIWSSGDALGCGKQQLSPDCCFAFYSQAADPGTHPSGSGVEITVEMTGVRHHEVS